MSIQLKPTDKISVMGNSGEGKSVLFRQIVEQLLKQGVPVVLYDSEHEFKDQAMNIYPNLRIYKPTHANEPDNIQEFDRLCGTVYDMQNVFLAVNSIDFYTDPKRPVPMNFKKIIHWGRKRKIGYMVDSRRPADVHKDVVALCHHWFLFHCYIDNDIKWLKKFVGRQADELRTLESYHYFHWTRKGATQYQPIPAGEARRLEATL